MDFASLSDLGVAGALVVVVGYLLIANHRLMTTNRAEYLAALFARETQHTADLSAMRIALASPNSNAAWPTLRTTRTPSTTVVALPRTPPRKRYATTSPPSPRT